MNRMLIKEKGNVIFSVAIFACVLMALLILFMIVISKSTFNLMIHDAKSDLYLVGRNVVFAIQRDLMGEDIESVDYDEMLEKVENRLRETWNLNKNLKNGNGLIKEAEIEHLCFLETYDGDPVTGRPMASFSLHMLVRVKFMPIIFSGFLDDKCEFSLHEDIQIEKMELE